MRLSCRLRQKLQNCTPGRSRDVQFDLETPGVGRLKSVADGPATVEHTASGYESPGLRR